VLGISSPVGGYRFGGIGCKEWSSFRLGVGLGYGKYL